MWNYSLYGQSRYNQNLPLALAVASATVSVTSSGRLGTTLAGSATLSIVVPDTPLGKTIKLGGTPLIKFTQDSELIGAGGALLESDSVNVSIACFGALDLGFRSSTTVAFTATADLIRTMRLAGNANVALTNSVSLLADKKLITSPTVVSLAADAALRTDIVMGATPTAMSFVVEGRLANTLNVSAVAISTALANATLDLSHNLSAAAAISFINASAQLSTNLVGDTLVQLQAAGALRVAANHELVSHPVVQLSDTGAIDLYVPLAGDVGLCAFTAEGDLFRFNNKTLAGDAPVSISTAPAALDKSVSLVPAASSLVQLSSSGGVDVRNTLAGAVAFSVSTTGAVGSAVRLAGAAPLAAFTSIGFLSAYPFEQLFANIIVSKVEIYAYDIDVEVDMGDISVAADTGAIDVEAEVFFIDVRKAA